jgi:ferredoxin
MRVFVDPETCTGCGLCADQCPEVFRLDGDVAVGGDVPADQVDCARQMIAECPAEAISEE